MEPAVRVTNLSIGFRDLPLFENLSVEVPMGKITSIIGPNGAGKTTLILAMLGFIDYVGDIIFFRERKNIRIGYVPQRLALPGDTAANVLDLFAVHLHTRPLFLGYGKKCRNEAAQFLGRVGLAGYENKKLAHLSGGEFQRALLAVALATSPDMLILDEPASGVDVRGGEIFDDLIKGINSQYGITVIMVSHDLHAVSKNSDHVICLNREIVCEGPPEKALTVETINRAFSNPSIYSSHVCRE